MLYNLEIIADVHSQCEKLQSEQLQSEQKARWTNRMSLKTVEICDRSVGHPRYFFDSSKIFLRRRPAMNEINAGIIHH